MTAHVWYAAYGSNLSPQRFDCYVSGGRPEGARRTYTGCRDTSRPSGCRPIRLPGLVFFGAESTAWGGGMAFYDPDGEGPSLATAYRLTAEQFADVWFQERRLPVGGALPLPEALAAGEWVGGGGLYDRVLVDGAIEEEPVLTITFPATLQVQQQPPSPAYAATIERGLIATHGLSRAEAAAYIAGLISGRTSCR
ncbi:histone deacetylase [Flexivirga alba]|uniref:Histone deacetylase n=1 Tax=Flexivirga alba TaxID=702742 RepID=A0ABW2ALT4_9MICO